MGAARILVVDDNPANLKLMRLTLTAAGHEVVVAATAGQALHLVGVDPFELVLMDIQLPDMDGLSATRKIKSDPRTKDIPVVAVTAYAMRGDAERAHDAGCDGYVTKPIDTRALAGLVAGFVANRPSGETAGGEG